MPEASRRPGNQMRRRRIPPRNEEDDIICDHSNCRGKNVSFKRACEWNKHMDRHERPYKCLEPGCEMNAGFTYSGGLLRHQREVHKMHQSTKQPLFCPFPNCKRSSGTGFTRKENLEEHKRRRHLEQITGQPTTTKTSSSYDIGITQDSTTQKRKRTETVGKQKHESEEADSDSQTIKRLRMEVAKQDEFIRGQTIELNQLRTLLRSLPTQVYQSVSHQIQQQGPT